ncbi:tRNA (adenosine(37)-N6)-threonylcarbamoyltransferase complex ATPase subunit type 1 TsaE [Marimonas sp. MJW-29]|uniref:tRNA threonylcarbamoyladenosine biosynthesis protein TsaE n=1 Tax=Sulfitobacter sediminis TaxID=3234186 RepID=A0ABV3RPM2_9RHOB
MATKTRSFHSSSPDETARFAAGLAAKLSPGDVILLEGDVGAGKTHFARALIQSLLEQSEDVPSPTFTLVQTYATPRGEIWHADLYRVTSTLEIEELGLIDAFGTEICLVEWPDRLGTLAPADALTLAFQAGKTDEARQITARWSAARWDDLLGALAA